MKVFFALNRSNKFVKKVEEVRPYVFEDLKKIFYKDLPNNGFGIKNYEIIKSKFNKWPVYSRIQRQQVSTEIKRIKGDVEQFKKDLLKINSEFVIDNKCTNGNINIKGDHVNMLKKYFDENVKVNTVVKEN